MIPPNIRGRKRRTFRLPQARGKRGAGLRTGALWAIAERFYGDGDKYTRIAKANNITNPDRINPGQKIIIPD